ncbi:hypothetical protein AQJ46_45875 [Streptomyces canus]|uniref:Uncharacterized protein n=1 Tax=Streptomyces canus TaxID=58343 RepID=A0A124HV97_9ACTN|nr:hypothetical protein [Streptomyces canus]KUN57749.1 hypothetical protein AQJ46_45875 [Streptomyces canus]
MGRPLPQHFVSELGTQGTGGLPHRNDVVEVRGHGDEVREEFFVTLAEGQAVRSVGRTAWWSNRPTRTTCHTPTVTGSSRVGWNILLPEL